MNRSDIVRQVAAKAEVTIKEADAVIAAFEDVTLENVKAGEKVSLLGFLSFEAVERSARTGRNPATGAALEIPARQVVKVSAGSKVKNLFKTV